MSTRMCSVCSTKKSTENQAKAEASGKKSPQLAQSTGAGVSDSVQSSTNRKSELGVNDSS